MKTKESNKGITLIALVITIIVLLILAGVSLSLITGSDGILGRSEKAVDQTNINSGKEQAELLIADYLSEYYEEAYVNANQSVANQKAEEYIQGKISETGMATSAGDYFVTIGSDNAITVYKGTSVDENNKTAEGTLLSGGKVEWKNVDIDLSDTDADVLEFTGKNFNTAIKQLANGDGTYDKYVNVDGTWTPVPSPYDYGYGDNIITGIEVTNILPTDDVESQKLIDTFTNENIVIYVEDTIAKVYSEDGIVECPQDSSYMFAKFKNIVELDLTDFDASNATTMAYIFSNCGYNSMTALNLGNNFDTLNVTDMEGAFEYCGGWSISTINWGDKFDTSNVTNMSKMFSGMNKSSLDLNINTSSAKDMSYMFAYAYGLTDLNLGDNFNTVNVTNMEEMFYACGYNNLTSLDLGNNFNTVNVTNMKEMFNGCGHDNMTSLNLGSNFDTSNVTNMTLMFTGCGQNKMTSLDLGAKFSIKNSSDSAKYSFGGTGTSDITIYAPQEVADYFNVYANEYYRTLTAKTY